jgi:hypothetical protein
MNIPIFYKRKGMLRDEHPNTLQKEGHVATRISLTLYLEKGMLKYEHPIKRKHVGP